MFTREEPITNYLSLCIRFLMTVLQNKYRLLLSAYYVSGLNRDMYWFEKSGLLLPGLAVCKGKMRHVHKGG